MGFGQAISAGFSNYVNFSDRSSRSEFWWWILFYVLGGIVASIIDWLIGTDIRIVSTLFWLAMILPNLAVSIRRLHDLDRTGWWVLLGLIVIIGWIILLIWYCTKGTDGPNRFGPDPLAGAASQMRAA